MTKQQITSFNFKNMPIRIVEHKGEPWFVAVDVCRALNIQVKSNGEVNVTQALKNLDKNELTLSKKEGIHRGNPKTNLISESGLYKLIMRSNKPEAKAFQNWVVISWARRKWPQVT